MKHKKKERRYKIPISQLKRPRANDSLQKIIDDYDSERFFCLGDLMNFESIVDCICGRIGNPIIRNGKVRHKRSRHQFRLRNTTIEDAEQILINKKAELEQSPDFESLIDKVGKINIWGFGSLATYDFCIRFGYKRGIRPEKYVYLHAGTKEGAKNLKRLIPALNKKEYSDKIPVDELPSNLKALGAMDIENLLCIFKARLATLNSIE